MTTARVDLEEKELAAATPASEAPKVELTESEQFDAIVKKIQSTNTWDVKFGKIKEELAVLSSNLAEKVWDDKVKALLVDIFINFSNANAAEYNAGGSWGALKNAVMEKDSLTNSLTGTIKLLGQLGRYMPEATRGTTLLALMKVLDDPKLKNSLIRKSLNRVFGDFGNSIPDVLRAKVVLTLINSLFKNSGDVELISTALVPFWNDEFLKIVPQEVMPTVLKLLLTLAKGGYFAFMAVAPALEAMHRVPEVLPAGQKEEIKQAIDSLPYAGAHDYDKLVKTWSKPESPKASVTASVTLFGATKTVEEKEASEKTQDAAPATPRI